MTYPWWTRRPDLDDEICSIMNTSELTVYLDEPHGCLHIMRGDEEFTSVLYPLDDKLRDDLRQQAYIANHSLEEDEIRRVRDANEKQRQYEENMKDDARAETSKFGVWEYKHRFEGLGVTPMIINPGVPHDS